MTIYKKSQSLSGNWLKGADVTSGTKCFLMTEVTPQESNFTDRNGKMKMQDVAKIKFQGQSEAYNISLNRATVNALVDAFGEDSRKWINQVLTAMTEKAIVGGKRVTVVYLLPEGYETHEDDEGYVEVVRSVPEAGEMPDEVETKDIPF
jgi:hypothetical protein